MPPEPLSCWDRNREKRSSDGGGGIRSVARWRDSHHHHPGGSTTPRNYVPRWDDHFRRPPPQGHHHAGGYQLFPEDSAAGYGGLSFRSADDTSYRPFSSSAARPSGYGKYGIDRNTRDARSYRPFPVPGQRQQHDFGVGVGVGGQRSVSDLLTYHSHPSSHIDASSSWDHYPFDAKLPSADAFGSGSGSGSGSGYRGEREHLSGSVAWKPLKWNRSTSLSSRASGFSRTSSSDENKSGRATPVRSPSAGNGLVRNDHHFEDTCPRKKQRLGWGQGLAKYEKQKVEGSDETLTTSTLIQCGTITRPSQSNPNMSDESAGVTVSSECEKQKVESSDDTRSLSTLTPCGTIARPSQNISNMPEKSPRVTGSSEFEQQKVEISDETISRSTLIPCGTIVRASQSNSNMTDESHRVTEPSECEKQKVEGCDETLSTYTLIPCGTATMPPQSNSSMPENSPRVTGPSECEKPKVKGSDETLSTSTLVLCATVARRSPSNSEMPDKSPRVARPSECASPATTSSIACSSSQAIDDRPHITATINDIDACNLKRGHEFQSCLEEFSANLECLSSATNLSSLLTDVLQIEDKSCGDSNFVKSTAMNKLLLVKNELSKALEKTECEIDLFENELNVLDSQIKSSTPDPGASGSLVVECTTRSCKNSGTATKLIQKPSPLQLMSSSDMHTVIPNLCNGALEEDHGDVKEDDIDSPGTATSKFVEPLCMEKAVSANVICESEACSADMVAASPASSGKLWCMPSILMERTTVVDGDRVEQNGSVRTDVPSDLNLESNLKESILISNKNSARQAFEELGKSLPTLQPESDMWGSCNISCHKNISLVKERLATRKRSKRFKERVLTLKFKALQHLWKEDLRLLSIKKYKAKSQKRIESNSRTPQIVYQKHRSSTRSRFTSPAGSLTLVPTSEVVDFTSKLLCDSQIKLCRDSLKMPSLVDEEKSRFRFVSDNNLIEDPCATEKERVMINPWTPLEKEVFLEKFSAYGKNFKKIASYFEHKTTADCVEFYYKNHKSECFEKIKKKKSEDKGLPTNNTYLMTSGKKWNCDVNDAASLVLLGEASVIAAGADNDSSMKSQHMSYPSRPFLGDDASREKWSSVDMRGDLSSEAMSSCVTVESSRCQEGKLQKSHVMDGSPIAKITQSSVDDEETCSDESCEEMDGVDWTDEEKLNFVTAWRSYGKDFMKIARCVRSRSKDQCKVFFSKARRSLGLDGVNLGTTGREGTPMSDATSCITRDNGRVILVL